MAQRPHPLAETYELTHGFSSAAAVEHSYVMKAWLSMCVYHVVWRVAGHDKGPRADSSSLSLPGAPFI